MPSLPDSALTSSSDYDANHSRIYGRLNLIRDPNWSAATNNTSQWMKVDLGTVQTVAKVATQGRYGAYAQWVTSYKISYSNDNVIWSYYGGTDLATATIFTANTDQNTIVTNSFSPSIEARYVRLHPVTWYNHISMRMEVYSQTGSIANTTNTFLGLNAGNFTLTATGNTGIGRDSLMGLTTGSANTALGTNTSRTNSSAT